MKDKVTNKQLREFGLLIGFVFPVLIGWIFPGIAGHGFRAWTLWIGVPALTLALLSPRLLHTPYQLWMKLGLILGWINNHLTLGLIFLVVLQPIALLMGLFGYDPLKKSRKEASTYREICQNHQTDLTRIF